MEKPLTSHIQPDFEPLDIKEYEKAGGFEALRNALQKTPSDIQKIVTDST